MSDRVCRVCGGSLAGRRSDATVCGARCWSRDQAEQRKTARRGSEPRICPVCGGSMDHMRADVKACSRRCRDELTREETNARRRAKHGPAELERQRKWRQENRDSHLSWKRAYRQQPHVKAAHEQYMETWRRQNADRLREYEQQYRVVNADVRRQYPSMSPEARALVTRRRQAVKLSRSRLVTTRDLNRQLERQRRCCGLCGTHLNKWEWDHIVPISRGGWDSVGNLWALCLSCNRWKSTRLLSELRAWGQVPPSSTQEVEDARTSGVRRASSQATGPATAA